MEGCTFTPSVESQLAAMTAERDALRAALVECRRWLWNGDLSDGLDIGHWTDKYKRAHDMVEAALGSATVQPTEGQTK